MRRFQLRAYSISYTTVQRSAIPSPTSRTVHGVLFARRTFEHTHTRASLPLRWQAQGPEQGCQAHEPLPLSGEKSEAPQQISAPKSGACSLYQHPLKPTWIPHVHVVGGSDALYSNIRRRGFSSGALRFLPCRPRATSARTTPASLFPSGPGAAARRIAVALVAGDICVLPARVGGGRVDAVGAAAAVPLVNGHVTEGEEHLPGGRKIQAVGEGG
jgi:hypothetical protein